MRCERVTRWRRLLAWAPTTGLLASLCANQDQLVAVAKSAGLHAAAHGWVEPSRAHTLRPLQLLCHLLSVPRQRGVVERSPRMMPTEPDTDHRGNRRREYAAQAHHDESDVNGKLTCVPCALSVRLLSPSNCRGRPEETQPRPPPDRATSTTNLSAPSWKCNPQQRDQRDGMASRACLCANELPLSTTHRGAAPARRGGFREIFSKSGRGSAAGLAVQVVPSLVELQDGRPHRVPPCDGDRARATSMLEPNGAVALLLLLTATAPYPPPT